MEELRFAMLVRDIDVDDALFRLQMRRIAAADRTYVIMFAARSGSSWLTSILSATGRLGYPGEYLNPGFIPVVAKAQNSRDPEGVLHMLKRRRKTPNGVFGIEVRAVDVELLGEEVFLRVFDEETVFFHLWRNNIVAQGISLFRAVLSRHYHSVNEQDGIPPPAYDAEGIRHWVSHVAGTENSNVRLLQRARRPARSLCYEDIIRDRAGTIDVFARVLDEPLESSEFAEPVKDELRKIGDGWNIDAESRFRRDEAAFVEGIETARLVKIGIDGGGRDAADIPTTDAAYLAGRRAGVAGEARRRNPYAADVEQAKHWREGWNAGWDTQLRLTRSESVQNHR